MNATVETHEASIDTVSVEIKAIRMKTSENTIAGLLKARGIVKDQICICSIPPKKDDSQLKEALKKIDRLIKQERKELLMAKA